MAESGRSCREFKIGGAATSFHDHQVLSWQTNKLKSLNIDLKTWNKELSNWGKKK